MFTGIVEALEFQNIEEGENIHFTLNGPFTNPGENRSKCRTQWMLFDCS